ncbi:MAG: hypothetical protein J6C32_03160, partial [Eubacterium sp.]|nr:hypothetical protein [Eubacterium sp.]
AGKRRSIDISRYVSDEVGLPTLQDIMSELEKPGLRTEHRTLETRYPLQDPAQRGRSGTA